MSDSGTKIAAKVCAAFGEKKTQGLEEFSEVLLKKKKASLFI